MTSSFSNKGRVAVLDRPAEISHSKISARKPVQRYQKNYSEVENLARFWKENYTRE